jgi:hypothetical protein
VQEGKAGQGAAQPRNTSGAGAVGRAAKPHTAGQRQRQQQQQQSGKEHNQGQSQGQGYREGHFTADTAPTDGSMYGALTRVVQPP